MESKPREWSHLLLVVLLVSLHRSSHAQPATSSTWPGSTVKDTFSGTHFSDILIALLSSSVFLIFFSLLIRHCVDTCATTRTHISSTASDGRRRRDAIDRCPVLVCSDVKDLRIGNCSALECAVCLIEFEDTDKIRLLPKCNHVFHPDCIDRWFSSRLTCPVCRAKITPSDKGDADAVTESNHDESSVEDSEIEQQSTMDSTELPRAETIDADDEIGSSTGNLPTGAEQRILPRSAAERFARSHSTGHYRFMESEEVIERYTLRLPEHVMEEIFGKQKRRIRRCASSNDVVLLGEWSSKKGSDHNMERWVLPCMTTGPPPFSKDLSFVKLLKQNSNKQSSWSSRRPPI